MTEYTSSNRDVIKNNLDDLLAAIEYFIAKF